MKNRDCLLSIFLACILVTSSCIAATDTPALKVTITLTPLPAATSTVIPSPIATQPPQRQGVIAFYLKQGNMGGGIYVIRGDGSGDPVMLSAHPSNDSKPTWSPDGTKLAFESIRDDLANQKYMDIYMMNSDGSQLTRLTNTDGWYTEPEWSPDGNFIVFASHGDDGKNLDLFLLDINGRELTRITDDPATERNASWSPDGSQIAYSSNAGGGWNIFTVDVETGEIEQLTQGSDKNAQPDWSPDGEKILFISNRDGDIEIYVMDANGKNQQRLTTAPGNDTDPEWSPDGNFFAYAHGDAKFGEIYISDLNGSLPELLFKNTGQYTGFPAWSASATISDEPVFGPAACASDKNGDSKLDTVTNTFIMEESFPYVIFPYRNMSPDLTTSVHWDYENSDKDTLNMALAWKHGESGWFIASAGGLPLSAVGPRKLTIQLKIGDKLMQEITCEVIEQQTKEATSVENEPIETAELGTNLALGKQVQVSRALATNPASMAVDGKQNNWWGAGAFAPQWIEIDLKANYVVQEFKLLPSQSPAGKTIHHLSVKGSATDNKYILLHTFEGETSDLQWLIFKPEEVLRGIRYVRIETVRSPSWVSWREIEIVAGE